MSEPTSIPPPRRADLVVTEPGDDGQQVVKDRISGKYFQFGPEESFLFSLLDGRHTVAMICEAFGRRFAQPLTAEDLDEFVGLVESSGFLQRAGSPKVAPLAASAPSPAIAQPRVPSWSVQSLLYWRKNFFDPNRFFSWLEPSIRFLWTTAFLFVSLLGILAALVVLIGNREELLGYFFSTLRWETLALVWLSLVVATFCHEFAHGLTCKHYGGEVHEVGFLLMFGLPCFYCNVSDAWLFRERYKRLLVTLAGGYCDLCIWAVAVFVWRLTPPGTTPHHLAYVVLTVCGGRIFFNFNPFLKLDGYYLLSDWVNIPNLRQRSQDRLMATVRRLLWGGPRPEPTARARFLILYGAACWLMMLSYGLVLFVAVFYVAGPDASLLGKIISAILCFLISRSLFEGISKGEVGKMFLMRYKRLATWGLVLAGLAAVLIFVEIEDRRGGSFQVRPGLRAELRACSPAFLRVVYFEEGDRVGAMAVVAHLDIPDLDSRILQKRAEIREVQAKLQLLEVGPRPEEVKEQRARIERAKVWCEQGRRDLAQGRVALVEDLIRLDKQLTQRKAELEYAEQAFRRDARLHAEDVLPKDQYLEKKKNYEVGRALMGQGKAERNARDAKGTLEAESELGKREKDLADARATLALLELGTRPQEVEAERARLDRLREEVRYLEGLHDRLQIICPVDGVITTPRLKEKVGQYFKEGDLICTVDRLSQVEVEIALDEQDVAHVHEGSTVHLKARAFLAQPFQGEVIRIAPATRKEPSGDPARPAPAPRPDAPGTITIYATVTDGEDLQPGMTGYARIDCGRRSIGSILLQRVRQFVRPEYSW